jgi:hypothetical protein
MATGKKKLIETVVGVSIAIIVAFLVKQLFFKPTYDNELMNAAGELNENLPIMINDETRLDNVMATSENTFMYNYTLVNMVADSIDVIDMRNFMEPRILNDVRTNPGLKAFRDRGTTMVYNYKDENGVFLLKIAITADQYNE